MKVYLIEYGTLDGEYGVMYIYGDRDNARKRVISLIYKEHLFLPECKVDKINEDYYLIKDNEYFRIVEYDVL